jgi:threonyl-tRNA synthetase
MGRLNEDADVKAGREVTDHRRLGRQLGLFATHPLLGPGLPLWLPPGAAVRAVLERFITDVERRAGYRHVYTPALAKQELYERSGHWDHYGDDMFPPMAVGEDSLVLRPMNCPHHILVYSSEERSWRDLPFRVAELAAMYRDEPSGVVGGLTRVRAMTLNDAHVFCEPEQIADEVAGILAMIERCYAELGLTGHRYRLSLREPGDSKFVDGDGLWDQAEGALRAVLRDLGAAHFHAAGEAAFYGPKIDVQVRDRNDREYTLSTVQLDFHLPGRFELAYTGRDGRKARPVMVHRSIVSTMERMVAHLLETYGARLPLWLSPEHVVVIPVNQEHRDSATALAQELIDRGVRAEVDDRDHTLAARIRRAQQRQIPCMAVVGDAEVAGGTVAVRLRDDQRVTVSRTGLADTLTAAIDARAHELQLEPR